MSGRVRRQRDDGRPRRRPRRGCQPRRLSRLSRSRRDRVEACQAIAPPPGCNTNSPFPGRTTPTSVPGTIGKLCCTWTRSARTPTWRRLACPSCAAGRLPLSSHAGLGWWALLRPTGPADPATRPLHRLPAHPCSAAGLVCAPRWARGRGRRRTPCEAGSLGSCGWQTQLRRAAALMARRWAPLGLAPLKWISRGGPGQAVPLPHCQDPRPRVALRRRSWPPACSRSPGTARR